MRAEFQLDLKDGLSGPLDKIIGIFDRIDAALGRIGGNDPFDKLWEPVERATRATEGLNETLERTDAAMGEAAASTTTLNETLGQTTTEAREASGALTGMAESAEAAASRSMAAMRAIHEQLDSGYGASGGGRFVPGVGAYLGNVRGSVGHFGEAVESGVGRAFGAAAAGFGLIEPVHAAAEFNNTLTHIGIGLGYDGDANRQFASDYGVRLDQLARQTSQRGVDLADAAGFFSREGYSGSKLDAVLPTVAHISTAYNAAPEAVAKSTFALQENLGVGDRDLGGALAAIALAGKQADLPFEKLAPLLPQVAAQAGMLGVTGRSGVNDLAAVLAVARKSTGTEGEAVTNTRAFLQAITSPHTAKRFAEFGVDLFGTEANARRAGLDPMMAVLQQVNRITNGGRDARTLGTLFNNQEDRAFVTAVLQHMDQFFSIRGKVAGADQSVIDRDFRTGLTSTTAELGAFEESLAQLARLVGDGFVPVLHVMTIGLHHVIDGIEALNKASPKALPILLAIVGGVIAFAAVMAALGAVLIPLRAGFGLIGAIMGPLSRGAVVLAGAMGLPGIAIAALAVGLGVAALEIYKHWESVRHGFTAFGSWLESWAGWLLHLGRHGDTGSTGRPVAMTGSAGLMPPIQLHVTTDPGVRATVQPNPRLQVKSASGTGRMLSRP